MKIWYFLGEFIVALLKQLESDDARQGDTWLMRPRKGQEERIYNRIVDYYKEFYVDKKPMPWLKVVGLAMIGWIREQHPEIWPE